jgi:hypothetical protein
LRSSRAIEKRCRVDVRYMFLMDGLRPDHATICRFRRTLGEQMDSLIAQTVGLAASQGIAEFKTATIDGARLASAATQWRKYRKEAAEADGDSDENEGGGDSGEGQKPSSDPEARVQRLTSGGFVYGYNGQALVDAKSGMVLSTHMSNCASDAAELIPTLDKCLEMHGELPEKAVADAGYDTPANAEALALSGVEGWVAPKDEKWQWTADEQGNPVCLAGQTPKKESSFKRPSGVNVTRLKVKGCKTCSMQEECKAKAHQTISFPSDVNISHQVMLRDRYAKSEEEAKRMRRLRAQTAELTFAIIKERFKLRRLLLRGIKGAEIEFNLAALALNFMILKRKLAVEEIESLLTGLHSRVTALLYTLSALLAMMAPRWRRSRA